MADFDKSDKMIKWEDKPNMDNGFTKDISSLF